MLVSLEMRGTAGCPQCRARTPLVGLRTKLTCYACSFPIDYEAYMADAWDGGARYYFGAYYDVLGEAVAMLDEGEETEDTDGALRFRKHMPTCDCGAALDPTRLRESIGGRFRCTCGEEIAVRAPDDETRTFDPRIAFVVGDAKAAENVALASGLEDDSTVASCASCGAPLAADGTRRTVACKHCSVMNVISDNAWGRLHPRPNEIVWFLVYEVTPEEELAMWELFAKGKKGAAEHYDAAKKIRAKRAKEGERNRAERVARALAMNVEDSAGRKAILRLAYDGLSPEQARDVDAKLDDGLRRHIAKGQVCNELARLWTRAKDPSMRRIVAEATGLDAHVAPELFAILSRDDDAAIRIALAGREDLPAEVLERLAVDAAASVRAAIAARADATPAILKKLRDDGDATVVAAVKANPRYDKSFLEKIFG